ncbi:polysaccharide deacetylase family protein [Saccharothrix violaceirubra]|uniref:Peptidoglycan/xylan/chitin deacetylase (PgdA/CDA1 family) n=1 Tax=Saccharothrix violaceirubra TaxID=413306 RepID=A0A7W7WXB3_9PSEU|nr:polysaccharide deacetylase family protein [Saccharothrix violaceirubra]MBB4967220.1 peptidoglycan/xylan/chitin deacetylase (PgdA/CDA1 family) [Saccharothrix violaceirubra]
MRKWVVVAVVAVLVVVGTAVGGWRLASARTFQLFGDLTSAVETDQRVVALTFDDGPDPAGTADLLRTLADKDVPATFYLTGRELVAHPDLGRAIAAAGHEIGNHSFSHRRMVLVTSDFVADEVERTDAAIRATGYTGPITFRPPYGKKLVALPHYLARHDRRTVMWDLEPDSSPEADKSAEAIARSTVEQARPGSIILLHGMYANRKSSRDAVGPIVDGLRAKGFRFVTVSGLLALGSAR